MGPTSFGEASFVDQGYGSMLAGNGSSRAAVTVEMRSLTAVLETIPPVHLMKMDIQGAELVVPDAGERAAGSVAPSGIL